MKQENSIQKNSITYIKIENFKGISDPVRIDLKPITLLFGGNSAGKSTILQSLQYVREILERNNTNPDKTMNGGDSVDLGGFRNLVNMRDPNKRIAIEVELALKGRGLPDLVPESFNDSAIDNSEVWEFYVSLQETINRVETVSVKLVVAWSVLRNTAVVVGYHVGANGVWLAEINATEDGRDVSFKLNKHNPIFILQLDDDSESILELNQLLDIEDWISASDIGDEKTVELEDDMFISSSYSILPGILYSVREAGMEKPGDGLRAWLVGFNGALPKLDSLLDIPSPGAIGADNLFIAREFTSFISSLIIGPGMLLRDELSKLRYVGPIRLMPRRDFDVSLTKDDARWADGLAGWEALLSGENSFVEEVSDWMADSEKLATGYQVERHIVSELPYDYLQLLDKKDHEPEVLISIITQAMAENLKAKILLVDSKNGISLQPRDVGIGISQVLPVVAAALEPSASIVTIEQPELHIHPAIQVGLGDLFIHSAFKHGMTFLIETHSEHLMLRLLRRIREAAEEDFPAHMPKITPEDINVIYVERTKNGMVLSPIEIDANGKFLGRWPQGFFSERMLESLSKDVREKVEAKRRETQ